VNLSAFNVNLLVVLDAVLSERSATAAARRLHVTQSAVSNALARLREQLGDPLVVRHGRGLALTPFAAEIAPRVAAIVGEIAALVERDRRFDPTAETRELSLACADNQELSDMPRVLRLFAARLPRATLRVVGVQELVASDGLASGRVDLAIAPAMATGPGLHHEPLYVEEGVAVVRRGHPTVGKRLTRADFEAIPHVDVRVAGDTGIGHRAGEALRAQLGLRRRVAMIVPHFMAAAVVVSQSDHLAALPRRFAVEVARMLPLRVLELPFPPPQLPLALVWHQRAHDAPVMRFFRQVVLDALGTREPRRRPTRQRP
jgi:DNA-binding transcriptional LysR family regulator